jgi:cell division protein ZapA
VEVRIAGQSYAIKTDADEGYVHELAGFVDDRIREVQRGTRTVAMHSVAILAALHIADELFRERRGRKDLQRRVREKSRVILDYLETEGSKVTPHGQGGGSIS